MVQLTRPVLPKHAFGWVWPVLTLVVGAAVAIRPELACPRSALRRCWPAACVSPHHCRAGRADGLGVRTQSQLTGVEEVGYLDEGVVVLCAVVLPLRRLATGRRTPRTAGTGLVHPLRRARPHRGDRVGMPGWTLLVAAFVMFKGAVLGWAIAQIDWAPRDLRLTARVGVVVIVVCLAAVAANLLMPHVWAALLGNRGELEFRASIPSLIGPFVHPLDLGEVMTAAAVALVAWRAVMGRRLLSLVLLIGTGAAAVLSFRRNRHAAVLGRHPVGEGHAARRGWCSSPRSFFRSPPSCCMRR